MTEYEKLVSLSEEALLLNDMNDKSNWKRLKTELREIEVQHEAPYILGLVESGVKYPVNENNLLVCYLLGICNEVELKKDPIYEMGEFPDIDTDFIKDIQIYLKNVWAPQQFGQDFVSNIGNYGTFGLKQALIDMATVHGHDRSMIQAITTRLEAKDDVGDALTLDQAKKLYEDLRNFLEANPDVEDATRRILNRNKMMGKHAGGLIISNSPISDLVPLVRGADGSIQSAWPEGMHSQDLQPVGLVKYDILVLNNLMQLAYIVDLVKKRHGLDYICSMKGQDRNWSDISYLNDKAAIAMANAGDLKCVFQFDSPGIRKMVKGNVSRFDDMVAFSALWRPGPLGCVLEGTLVETTEGDKPIESLLPGHDQIGYIDGDGRISYTKRFLLQKTGNKKLFKIKTKSGKTILCSGDHPFLTDSGEYLEASKLTLGTKLATKNRSAELC